ncbi:Predicted ATPase [Acholeplasma oculi]|uniref:p-loop containing nucleoside triphosphate hydrolase n=1 Tax=Acholeplasma oculi TaxID=35623 RepID=A0A061AC51_9MOLU|nr:ATP-binding protein [Acholeplasma oculi]CDR31408.1 P-loop containing nucleoside triphosphate hydrolase [Acholeplasma oculi]SKC39785.1 hypothetical protein SAMN02745122_0767 [Acholeplasma oculi]SUT91931.1 Predicted ATPase [Acholeplasma oculi]
MIVMFRAKNFLSFKDDVVLDLRKSNFREHPDHTFKIGDFELLKTIAIYGANASGKSNLVCALSAFIDTIESQFYDENPDKTNEDSSQTTIAAFKPFLLTKDKNPNIEFEIVFYNSNHLFQYGFIVDKENKTKFIKEWLQVDREEVFTREETIKYGKKYEKIYSMFNKVREDRLLISTIDYFAVDDKQRELMSYIKEFFRDKVNVHFEIYFESSIKGLSLMSLSHYKHLINDNSLLKKVTEYVKQIDIGISNLTVHEIEINNKKTKEKEKTKIIKSVHSIIDENNSVIYELPFDLEDESNGTKRFISFINNIIMMMEKGGVYIIDELSSSFHPLLTKFIVDLFQSKVNKNNAQLIFTTHETTIMNRHQFRRDEIVVVDKNNKGESSIYSLADINVRSDASYDVDYFKGKYGGIPIIDDIFNGDNFHD